MGTLLAELANDRSPDKNLYVMCMSTAAWLCEPSASTSAGAF